MKESIHSNCIMRVVGKEAATQQSHHHDFCSSMTYLLMTGQCSSSSLYSVSIFHTVGCVVPVQ